MITWEPDDPGRGTSRAADLAAALALVAWVAALYCFVGAL